MKTAILATAFANGAAAPATTNSTAAAAKKAGAPKAGDRVVPVFTTVRTDVKPPVAAKRGAKSELAVKLEELPVGGSIGIQNKTKKQISSTISKVNNATANQQQKKAEDGSLVTRPEEIRDATGAVVGHKNVPVMERIKEFEAFDVDKKSDPDGATVRIFRNK